MRDIRWSVGLIMSNELSCRLVWMVRSKDPEGPSENSRNLAQVLELVGYSSYMSSTSGFLSKSKAADQLGGIIQGFVAEGLQEYVGSYMRFLEETIFEPSPLICRRLQTSLTCENLSS